MRFFFLKTKKKKRKKKEKKKKFGNTHSTHSPILFPSSSHLVALRELTLLLRGGRGLLGKEDRVDGRENTTTADGNVTKKLVELLIVTNGQLDVAGDDTLTLVITSSVTSELDDLGSQVLKNSSKVDRSTSTDTIGVVTLTKSVVDTTNGELKTSLGRAALGITLLTSTTARLGDGGLLGGSSSSFLGLRRHLYLMFTTKKSGCCKRRKTCS